MSDRIKASFSWPSLASYHLSPLWNISAGQAFELMLPVWFVVTVLLSAWVLASARRRGFGPASVTLWTLGTLFFPLVILPLYLITRSFRLRREKEGEQKKVVNDSENRADNERENATRESAPPTLLLRRSLPVIYLFVMMALGALYFYMDRRSPDAYHMRANQARVRQRSEQVIAEYHAALKIEDDAHTHNLLGKELQSAGRFEEALSHFRTAERMGEEDEELPLNMAQSLDELKRVDEARPEYERFLSGPLCVEMPYDRRCVRARGRVAALVQTESQQ